MQLHECTHTLFLSVVVHRYTNIRIGTSSPKFCLTISSRDTLSTVVLKLSLSFH